MADPADAFHHFEHQGWERAAAAYPGTFGELTAQLAAPLLDAAQISAGARVLDVATGPGYVAGLAAGRGARVIGIDFSPAMIAEARVRHPDIDFREGDAEHLDLPDTSVDAAVMAFGLLHLARPEAALRELHRVLAPGGRCALSVWAPPQQAIGFGILLDALAAHGTPAIGLPEGPPFFRFSDPREMRAALAQAGFAAIEVTVVPLVWRLTSPDQLFEAALHGSVRTAALLRAQTPAVLARIRAVAHDAVAAYRDGDGYALPMPAVLASATRH